MKLKKCKLHQRKNLIFLEYVDIDNILISSMISSNEKSYKNFHGYKGDDDYEIKPLHTMLIMFFKRMETVICKCF